MRNSNELINIQQLIADDPLGYLLNQFYCMRKIYLAALLCCIGGIVLAQDINFRQTIRGIVVDEQSGNVLSNVTVTVEGIPDIASITDSAGAFKLLHVPIGR